MDISVLNVAQWFLSKQPMTHKKLQKLCYYAQAWHLALLNRPLFSEDIQAWIHGPVCPALYAKYADYGWNDIPPVADKGKLYPFPSDTEQVLATVWDTYKGFDGDQLEALTHNEKPWQDARNGIVDTEPSHNVISMQSMRDFYKRLYMESQND